MWLNLVRMFWFLVGAIDISLNSFKKKKYKSISRDIIYLTREYGPKFSYDFKEFMGNDKINL